MRLWAWATAAGLALAGVARGGPLNKAWVPSDASWVVHVDIEAGVGSTVGSYLVANREAWGAKEWDEFRARTGIDPAADLKGLTIYGPTCDEAHAVAIIDATSATDGLLERLRAKEKSFTRVEGQRHTLDTWTEHGSPRYGYVRTIGDRRLIMVSRDKERLEQAISLTDAEQEVSASPAVAKGPREGSFLFVAALEVDEAAEKSKALMVRKVRDLRLDFGEAGGQLYGDMALTTGTDQDARDLLQMLEGGVAMGRMMAQSRPELAPLAEASKSLTLSASDSSVRATFTFDSARAVDMLRAAAEARAKGAGGVVAEPAEKGAKKHGEGDSGNR